MEAGYSIDLSEHNEMVRRVPLDRREKLRLLMEQHGGEAVNKIKALTAETTPDGRRKHIGGWADVTTNLVRAITSDLEVNRGSLTLYIGVMSGRGLLGISVDDVIEYAVHLDNMEGISVLGGVPKEAFSSLVRGIKNIYN